MKTSCDIETMTVCALSIGNTEKLNVDNLLAVSTEPRPTAWAAMLTADVPFFVAVGVNPAATTSSLRAAETSRPPLIVAVGAGERLSFLGTEPGTVWVTSVR